MVRRPAEQVRQADKAAPEVTRAGEAEVAERAHAAGGAQPAGVIGGALGRVRAPEADRDGDGGALLCRPRPLPRRRLPRYGIPRAPANDGDARAIRPRICVARGDGARLTHGWRLLSGGLRRRRARTS